MLHGSPTRSAHRAAPDGGLALLVRQSLGQESGPAGQHRQPRQRRVPREPQRTMHMVMSGLGAMIMVAICGLSGFFVIAEERRGHGAEAAGREPADTGRISSRATDPTPLSLAEVFPNAQIRLVPGGAPYVIGVRHIDTDCNIAVTGELGAVLEKNACNQVVRASMTAPYGGYQVTAGVFNLPDEAGAARAGERARQLVETGRGTFAAMTADVPGTDPLQQPLAQVGWRERGHYLIYCVIARPDGALVRDDDPYADRITADLVESYLAREIVDKRSSHA